MQNKNIKLGFLLIFLQNLLFWMAPWLLYMLKFVSLTEAATIQSVGIITSVVMEVPTGALSDLIGKKKTLIISFLLTGIGEMLMTFSPGFLVFLIAFIIMNTGYSFYSGTMDAFLYDTLVSGKRENIYSKVLARAGAFTSAALVLASLTGGFMSSLWIGLPFFMTGVTKLIAFIVGFFIDEPDVDTETFSFKNFARQTKRGFSQLFKRSMLQVTLIMITFGAFYTIAYEFLDDAAIISYGYNEVGIGILYSAMTLLTIPASLLYERISKKVKPFTLIFVGALTLVLNYIISPLIGVVFWTALFLIRTSYSPIRNNAITQQINESTESRIRATTISTYELIRRIPYVILAPVIGITMEGLGVKWFALGFSIALLILLTPQFIIWRRKPDA